MYPVRVQTGYFTKLLLIFLLATVRFNILCYFDYILITNFCALIIIYS